MKKRVVDAVFDNEYLRVQIVRGYGHAEYVHDEVAGDTRIAGLLFRRTGGYDTPAFENVLIDDEHIQMSDFS